MIKAKKWSVVITFTAIVAIVVTVMFFIIREASIVTKPTALVPDKEVRRAVSGIQPNQVVAVELNVRPRLVVLTGPRLISLFLTGLKSATIPEDGRIDAVNQVSLVMKNRRVGPFSFGAKRKIDCFSPTFIAGTFTTTI